MCVFWVWTFLILTSQRLLLQRIQPIFNFSQLVIIEPLVSALGSIHLQPLRDELVRKTMRRKDAWPSCEAARQTWDRKNWDPRVIDVFMVTIVYFYLLHIFERQSGCRNMQFIGTQN
jgi:hypothetical protein